MKMIGVYVSDEEYKLLLNELFKRKQNGENVSMTKLIKEKALKPFIQSLNGKHSTTSSSPADKSPKQDKEEEQPTDIPKKVTGFEFENVEF
jgi:hypothetical protein